MQSTNEKGTLGQAAAIDKLTRLGYNVALPIGVLRYDLVAEKDGRFLRIQVKTICASADADILRVRFYSKPWNAVPKKYRPDEVDVLVAYWPAQQRWFWFDLGLNVPDQMFLRVKPTRNQQQARIRLAQHYEV